MRPFRFRADAALAVRRRQEEDARRAVLMARAAMQTAEQHVTGALAALTEADRRGREAFQTTVGVEALIWQGNWIAGLEREVARAREALEERRIDERRAAEIAQHARMQVRVLEKLKDRAWRDWQLAARREEQKALDELGSLRFAARERATEE
jgi:flagellar protein FliJ